MFNPESYKFSINAIKPIKCYINSGIYCLFNESSTGKTYLCETLKKLKSAGENVGGYSYQDHVIGADINKAIPEDSKLCIIDRYDLYNGYATEYIKVLSNSCVVLIDCKTVPSIDCIYTNAGIILKEQEIWIV